MKITEEAIKSICSATMYKRGLDYFKEGRVHIKLREEQAIGAWVDDDELYNVRITMKGDKVGDYFCTCPYYQTMGSPCKHIIAALKLRQAELLEGDAFQDENDKIAQGFCKAFAAYSAEKTRLNLALAVSVTTTAQHSCRYGAALRVGFDQPSEIRGTEQFLDCYLHKRPFKFSKHQSYDFNQCYFDAPAQAVLDVLCEAYQNTSENAQIYVQKLNETAFGAYTFKRLLPLLAGIDCTYVIDGVTLPNLRIRQEDPDILVDVAATDDAINLSVCESGTALVPDGSYFFYEDDIYRTSPEWRSWFMPVYHALMQENRTQLDFRGNTAIDFATAVLPALRGQHGVVTSGLEDLVIDETPRFELYFDRYGDGISCAAKVLYGSVSLLLPAPQQKNDKIIVRDMEKEQELLSFFTLFSRKNGLFILEDETALYDFLFYGLKQLEKLATLYLSDSFKRLKVSALPQINSSVRLNSAVDLLEFSFQSTLSTAEIIGILRAVKLKRRFYRLPDGAFLDFEKTDMQAITLMEHLDFNEDDVQNGRKSLSKYHMLYMESLVQDGAVHADSSFQQLVGRLHSIRADIPPALNQVLRGYQKNGVHWLKQLSELGLGGILADDMGLGKTLQVIAFVMSERPRLPALVVTPSALTYNWLHEIQRFAPEARAKIVDGTQPERAESLQDIIDYDFIITSYPLLRRDLPIYSGLRFSFCFIDEAQHIKNPKTMNAKSVKKIKAERYFALTGTPVENSLTELWSIFDFVMKGYLYSHREFTERFERPVVREDDQNALRQLRRRIKPFILRRMKKDVLSELPDKIENTVYADFVPEQKRLYEAYMAAARSEVTSILAAGDNRIRILTLLMRLRQICCHPKLFDENYKKDSGKLLLLEELLASAIASDHRVLLFSQFTSMLSIIRERLDSMGISSFYLDGGTPGAERTNMAARFNAGEKEVFLISLKAGGTGLNLTGADMVIHYDPWWNPAVMDQASDRAYRIGQTKAVQVIKLAARGSIEEQIIKLQEKKRSLADGVIKENAAMLSALTKEELLDLFK